MKVLTIKQPWASLIALGEKHIETRSWKTKYRGTLLIHSRKDTKNLNLVKDAPFNYSISEDYQFPLGMIIAKCNFIACQKIVENDVTCSVTDC